jgi:hypothetical protein
MILQGDAKYWADQYSRVSEELAHFLAKLDREKMAKVVYEDIRHRCGKKHGWLALHEWDDLDEYQKDQYRADCDALIKYLTE